MKAKLIGCMLIVLTWSLLFCNLGWAEYKTKVVDYVFLTLRLEIPTTDVTGCVREITSSWSEQSVTWNTRPSLAPGNLDCEDINDTVHPWAVEFQLPKDRGQAWIDNPEWWRDYGGLACLNDGSTDDTEYYVFYSRDTSDSTEMPKPELSIWWHYQGETFQWYTNFSPVEDAYISEGDPDENNGGLADLFAGFTYPRPPNGFLWALMKFYVYIPPPNAVEQPCQVSGEVPERYALNQNYPNPFNSETTIRFDISQEGPVNLNIYNVTGQLVRELTSGQLDAGTYEVRWDCRDDMNLEVASGLYFCQLRASGFVKNVKMMFVK